MCYIVTIPSSYLRKDGGSATELAERLKPSVISDHVFTHFGAISLGAWCLLKPFVKSNRSFET